MWNSLRKHLVCIYLYLARVDLLSNDHLSMIDFKAIEVKLVSFSLI